jgi:hypothetical protein
MWQWIQYTTPRVLWYPWILLVVTSSIGPHQTFLYGSPSVSTSIPVHSTLRFNQVSDHRLLSLPHSHSSIYQPVSWQEYKEVHVRYTQFLPVVKGENWILTGFLVKIIHETSHWCPYPSSRVSSQCTSDLPHLTIHHPIVVNWTIHMSWSGRFMFVICHMIRWIYLGIPFLFRVCFFTLSRGTNMCLGVSQFCRCISEDDLWWFIISPETLNSFLPSGGVRVPQPWYYYN